MRHAGAVARVKAGGLLQFLPKQHPAWFHGENQVSGGAWRTTRLFALRYLGGRSFQAFVGETAGFVIEALFQDRSEDRRSTFWGSE